MSCVGRAQTICDVRDIAGPVAGPDPYVRGPAGRAGRIARRMPCPARADLSIELRALDDDILRCEAPSEWHTQAIRGSGPRKPSPGSTAAADCQAD